MADVNNRIRLQIVSELDAAGIKATKDQVDQLELGLRRAGNTGQDTGTKFGALEKTLGKLPGRLGELGGKLSGLAGQATMLAGAFSFGVEIGNQINSVLEKWGWFDGELEKLTKSNKDYDEELKAIKASLAEVVAEETKRMDAANVAAEKGLKSIDDQTAAYFRQAAALEGLRKAGSNAEMLQLERAKFEDMQAYSAAGNPEAAEQIGKYYDVLQAELVAKQQLADFDRESVKIGKELQSAEEAYSKATERAAAAKQKQEAAEAALAKHRKENTLNGWGEYYASDNEAAALKDEELSKLVERAKKDAERAAAVAAKRGERLENVDAEMLARQMDRANLAASGTLGIDRAAAAYDNYVAMAGNPLNADVDPSWVNELANNSQVANENQVEILDQVQRIAALLETALTGGE